MVEVIGSKYVEGTSKKSGKPYTAYIVYYTQDGADQGVNGKICGDAFVDKRLLNGQIPMPGDQIDLLYDKNGFLNKVIFY